MAFTKRTAVRLWRWRNNPLKRRSDILEAWVVAATWALVAVAVVAVGAATAGWVSSSISAQQSDRHRVPAVLTQAAPPAVAAVSGAGSEQVMARVRWVDARGATRTGTTRVPAGAAAGTSVTAWAGPHNSLVSPPPSDSDRIVRAGYSAVLAGSGAGALVFLVGLGLRAHIEVLRMRGWDAEWQEVALVWRRQIL
ncbi:Rv1733c family protein [Streptomyces sp. NBC_01465]|uniref:Rv1733c family protein n=1 Tax=Streptomyces sp. NBC_01465 TaxID=2903878 RepID=UPI002E363D2C|nr:hypothetical protein [Streptomyces sp. NBC_01465]